MTYKRSEGRRINYTPGADVSAGDVVVIGELVAVATEDIASGELGAVDIEGVFEFPKAILSSSAIAVGVKVYWDASGEVVTTTEGSNKSAGYTIEAAAAATAAIQVTLYR